MPTYVYRCEQCGAVLERRQRFQDAPLTECEACSGGALRRVLQPVSVIFRGSGFYSTDHRSNPTANPGEAKPGTSKDGDELAHTAAGSGDSVKTSSSGDSKPSTTPSAPAGAAPVSKD